ncbi:uroplakin-1a [Anolis sagrei]|uniref:uroplakin-1a n=1 Tax=Anolis sagrei TaxID=38937 RepID=UPI00295B8920|nr:uroplakin-1a [Anolis sagrei ordinatus]
MAAKGSTFVVTILVLGNVIIMLAGLALYAESVWVTADPYKVYPIMGVSGKDDVYAGAWISIFTGFCFFCVCVFGIISLVNGNRLMVLLYLVLILIVYLFECASCITSYTHRDFVVSNSRLITKQMLSYYSADSYQGRELTRMWNRFMMEQQCCGTNDPMDWVNYTSVFRSRYPEIVAPWPFFCCKRDRNFIIINEEGCRLGHVDYINTQGCFEHIKHAVQSYAWGVSWFGFAILMLTVPVVLLAIYHYTTM